MFLKHDSSFLTMLITQIKHRFRKTVVTKQPFAVQIIKTQITLRGSLVLEHDQNLTFRKYVISRNFTKKLKSIRIGDLFEIVRDDESTYFSINSVNDAYEQVSILSVSFSHFLKLKPSLFFSGLWSSFLFMFIRTLWRN